MRLLLKLIVIIGTASLSQIGFAQSGLPVSWSENDVKSNTLDSWDSSNTDDYESDESFDYISIVLMEDQSKDATMLNAASDFELSTSGLTIDQLGGSSYEQIMPAVVLAEKSRLPKGKGSARKRPTSEAADDLEMKNYKQTLPVTVPEESNNSLQKAGFLLFGVFGLGLAGFACWIPFRPTKPSGNKVTPRTPIRRSRKPRKPLTHWL